MVFVLQNQPPGERNMQLVAQDTAEIWNPRWRPRLRRVHQETGMSLPGADTTELPQPPKACRL